VREYYYPFESGLKSGTAEVYEHEIPGGQYSNLRPQAASLGLEHRFEQIKKNFAVVNRMFGDIVKVTPSSKAVGDMALFMTANGLTEQDVMAKGETLAFPDSVVDLFSGKMGQVEGGFPPELSRMVLKGKDAPTAPPGAELPPVDFEAEYAEFREEFEDSTGMLDFLSYKMYPQVFRDFYQHQQEFGEIDYLPTPAFLYGMQQDEEILVKLQRGKTISIRYIYRSKPDDHGNCTVTFELNGQTRSVPIPDMAAARKTLAHRKAVEENEVGAPLMGRLASVYVTAGEQVKRDQPLFVIEAMKMETTIAAPVPGKVKAVHLEAGTLVEQGDLVVELGRGS
jgi:pyruvate carboxylase